MARKWRYICMDCGRKSPNESSCRWCGSLSTEVMCCNTCDRARLTPENKETGYLYCSIDKKQHEHGDDCRHYLSMAWRHSMVQHIRRGADPIARSD